MGLNPYEEIKKATGSPFPIKGQASYNGSLNNNPSGTNREPVLDGYLDNRLRSDIFKTFFPFLVITPSFRQT